MIKVVSLPILRYLRAFLKVVTRHRYHILLSVSHKRFLCVNIMLISDTRFFSKYLRYLKNIRIILNYYQKLKYLVHILFLFKLGHNFCFIHFVHYGRISSIILSCNRYVPIVNDTKSWQKIMFPSRSFETNLSKRVT